MASTPVNNQYYPGLIRYLQQKHVYSREIDGTVDENNDGRKDARDGKISAKEWEYFFARANRYPTTIINIVDLIDHDKTQAYMDIPKLNMSDPESRRELTFFYLDLLMSGKPPSAMPKIAATICDLIFHGGMVAGVREAVAQKILSKPESDLPRNSINGINCVLAYIACFRIDPVVLSKIAYRLIDSYGPGKALRYIFSGWWSISVNPQVEQTTKDAIGLKIISILEAGNAGEHTDDLIYILAEIMPGSYMEPSAKERAAIAIEKELLNFNPQIGDKISGILTSIARDQRISAQTKDIILRVYLPIHIIWQEKGVEGAFKIFFSGWMAHDWAAQDKFLELIFNLLKGERGETYASQITAAFAKSAQNYPIAQKLIEDMDSFCFPLLISTNNPNYLRAAIAYYSCKLESMSIPVKEKIDFINCLVDGIMSPKSDGTYYYNIISAFSGFINADVPKEIANILKDTLLKVLDDPSGLACESIRLSVDSQNKLKEAAGYALISGIRNKNIPRRDRDEIARTLLLKATANSDTELSKFLISMLRNATEFVSSDIARDINVLVDKSLPTTPPYETWLKNKSLITIKIYFQSEENLVAWENGYLNKDNGFSVNTSSGNIVFTKTAIIKGVQTEVRIVAPKPSAYKEDFKSDVFEGFADPNIDWIVYAGHSGMGAELALSFRRAPKASDVILNGRKLFTCASCWSAKSYLGRFINLYPNSQFQGTNVPATDDVDSLIFGITLEGMLQRKSWKEIEADLASKKEIPFGYCSLPHQREQLNNMDSDGDGIPDSIDNVFNLGANTNLTSIDTFTFQPVTSEPPAGKLNQVAWDTTVSFSYDDYLKSFKDRISYPETGEFRNKGWFKPRENKADFLSINETWLGKEPTFNIEVNAGYSNCSIMTLKMMMIYELNKYFSENYIIINREVHRKGPPTQITPQEKLRGFLLSVEVLKYARRNMEDSNKIEDIYKKFIAKYALPRNIPLNLVLDALTIDDGPAATKTAKSSMERLKALIR